MIIAMSKLRIMGPRYRLSAVLEALQDLGTLHLAAPDPGAPLPRLSLTPAQARERDHLVRALESTRRSLDALAPVEARKPLATRPTLRDFARWARLAGRLERQVHRLADRSSGLEEERALILKYEHFFSAFRSVIESEATWPNAVAYHVLLKQRDAGSIAKLRGSLTAVIGGEFHVYSQPLPSGDIALLVVVSARARAKVEQLLARAGVEEIPVPQRYGGGSLTEAIPRMMARLDEIPRELEQIRRERAELGRAHGEELRRALAALHDRIREIEALPLSGVTTHAFVLEGWVPSDARGAIVARLQAAFGGDVVVSEISTEEWSSASAPVVLHNPRLLRPFEAIISLMPLPQYGSIDPTPFVAVFFPAFFGIMTGDIGYGFLLGILALVLRWKSAPDGRLRQVAEIGLACSVFSIIAGVLFGEFFGDLGTRWFGLRPVAFSREEALVPFLLLALALGSVHVVLGLVLGVAANIRHHPRHALGRGLSALMILLVIALLLTSFEVLPRAFFTPMVIALLAAFPVLIIAEGLVAPLELLSALGNILSYARIMALGIASVMLAIVANRMSGAMGSVAVGIVFALLFHLVNFAIALFSPTIHALRLHYVEFFGKFYSPGGVRYEPFGRWTRDVLPTHA